MRKRSLVLFALIMLCAFGVCLAGCEADLAKMSTLGELSRAYAGEYRCETFTLAGEDMLGEFAWIRLDLDYGGQAKVFWKRTSGGEGEYSLDYRADPEGEQITFYPPAGGARAFPMQGGTVRIELLLGGRYLYALFTRK